MKKTILSCIIIAAVLLGGLAVIQKVNFNRLGTDEYYTQIKGEGKKIEDKTDNGKRYISYEYKLPAFDKGGKQKILTFTAQKQLREKAYLLLFVKEKKGVTSYQEVKREELPKTVSEKLEIGRNP